MDNPSFINQLKNIAHTTYSDNIICSRNSVIMSPLPPAGNVVTFRLSDVGLGFYAILVKYEFASAVTNPITEIELLNDGNVICRYPFHMTAPIIQELYPNIPAEVTKFDDISGLFPVLLGNIINRSYRGYYPTSHFNSKFALNIKLSDAALLKYKDISATTAYYDYPNSVRMPNLLKWKPSTYALKELATNAEPGNVISRYGDKAIIPSITHAKIPAGSAQVTIPLTGGTLVSAFFKTKPLSNIRIGKGGRTLFETDMVTSANTAFYSLFGEPEFGNPQIGKGAGLLLPIAPSIDLAGGEVHIRLAQPQVTELEILFMCIRMFDGVKVLNTFPSHKTGELSEFRCYYNHDFT